MKLLIIAIAPVAIIATYVYFRDKYEKEPVGRLLLALLAGCLVPLPVLWAGSGLSLFKPSIGGWPAFYDAFVIAGFTEELFKFLVLFVFTWFSRHFNEKFDGIVYAVFISLGFAAVENVLYVFSAQDGPSVGLLRAFLSVPAHALFGITMGFYFGLAKFYPRYRNGLLIKSFLFPVLLHGIFDFVLMLGNMKLMGIFIPFVIFLYFDGFRKMRNLSERSIYNTNSSTQ